MNLKIVKGADTAWERALKPGGEPEDIAIPLAAGAGEIVIEVDRTGPLAFPCGLELWDAHLIVPGLKTTTQQPETGAETN